MNRRDLIRGIGAVICAGAVPSFLPRLIGRETGAALALTHWAVQRAYEKHAIEVINLPPSYSVAWETKG